MPWTVTEIMEAPSNETKIQECMTNMGPEVIRPASLDNSIEYQSRFLLQQKMNEKALSS